MSETYKATQMNLNPNDDIHKLGFNLEEENVIKLLLKPPVCRDSEHIEELNRYFRVNFDKFDEYGNIYDRHFCYELQGSMGVEYVPAPDQLYDTDSKRDCMYFVIKGQISFYFESTANQNFINNINAQIQVGLGKSKGKGESPSPLKQNTSVSKIQKNDDGSFFTKYRFKTTTDVWRTYRKINFKTKIHKIERHGYIGYNRGKILEKKKLFNQYDCFSNEHGTSKDFSEKYPHAAVALVDTAVAVCPISDFCRAMENFRVRIEEKKLRFFKTQSFLDGLDNIAYLHLLEAVEQIKYEPNTQIIRESQLIDNLFIVRKGAVTLINQDLNKINDKKLTSMDDKAQSKLTKALYSTTERFEICNLYKSNVFLEEFQEDQQQRSTYAVKTVPDINTIIWKIPREVLKKIVGKEKLDKIFELFKKNKDVKQKIIKNKIIESRQNWKYEKDAKSESNLIADQKDKATILEYICNNFTGSKLRLSFRNPYLKLITIPGSIFKTEETWHLLNDKLDLYKYNGITTVIVKDRAQSVFKTQVEDEVCIKKDYYDKYRNKKKQTTYWDDSQQFVDQDDDDDALDDDEIIETAETPKKRVQTAKSRPQTTKPKGINPEISPVKNRRLPRILPEKDTIYRDLCQYNRAKSKDESPSVQHLKYDTRNQQNPRYYGKKKRENAYAVNSCQEWNHLSDHEIEKKLEKWILEILADSNKDSHDRLEQKDFIMANQSMNYLSYLSKKPNKKNKELALRILKFLHDKTQSFEEKMFVLGNHFDSDGKINNFCARSKEKQKAMQKIFSKNIDKNNSKKESFYTNKDSTKKVGYNTFSHGQQCQTEGDIVYMDNTNENMMIEGYTPVSKNMPENFGDLTDQDGVLDQNLDRDKLYIKVDYDLNNAKTEESVLDMSNYQDFTQKAKFDDDNTIQKYNKFRSYSTGFQSNGNLNNSSKTDSLKANHKYDPSVNVPNQAKKLNMSRDLKNKTFYHKTDVKNTKENKNYLRNCFSSFKKDRQADHRSKNQSILKNNQDLVTFSIKKEDNKSMLVNQNNSFCPKMIKNSHYNTGMYGKLIDKIRKDYLRPKTPGPKNGKSKDSKKHKLNSSAEEITKFKKAKSKKTQEAGQNKTNTTNYNINVPDAKNHTSTTILQGESFDHRNTVTPLMARTYGEYEYIRKKNKKKQIETAEHKKLGQNLSDWHNKQDYMNSSILSNKPSTPSRTFETNNILNENLQKTGKSGSKDSNFNRASRSNSQRNQDVNVKGFQPDIKGFDINPETQNYRLKYNQPEHGIIIGQDNIELDVKNNLPEKPQKAKFNSKCLYTINSRNSSKESNSVRNSEVSQSLDDGLKYIKEYKPGNIIKNRKLQSQRGKRLNMSNQLK